MTVSIERAFLRRLISGWRPTMTVEVEVRVLTALIDELERLTVEVEHLESIYEGGGQE